MRSMDGSFPTTAPAMRKAFQRFWFVGLLLLAFVLVMALCG
ncbi:hypothetical protein [Rhodocaloribacter litoris]|nr:hypothetical protein [Rhodocaloribacter litoris]